MDGQLAGMAASGGSKMNPHCSGTPWAKPGLVRWEPAKIDCHEIKGYTFDEIVELLKVAQSKNLLPYFIFRLFAMARYDERIRFSEIHPKVKDHPPISSEAH